GAAQMPARAGRGHFGPPQAPAAWRAHRPSQTALRRFHHTDAPDFGRRTDRRARGDLSFGLLFVRARKACISPTAFARRWCGEPARTRGPAISAVIIPATLPRSASAQPAKPET